MPRVGSGGGGRRFGRQDVKGGMGAEVPLGEAGEGDVALDERGVAAFTKRE